MMKRRFKFIIFAGIGVLIGGGVSAGLYRQYQPQDLTASIVTPVPLSAPQAFIGELYDLIQKNYWDKITDEQLSLLFQLGSSKIASSSFELVSKDKVGVLALVDKATAQMDASKQNDFTSKVANIVLVNLKPFGRSSLYTAEQKKALIDAVSNVDHTKDLYQDLGLAKGASTSAVEKAYEQKTAELKKDKSPEAGKRLEAVAYAHKVLTSATAKTTYDKVGAEPTVFSKMLTPKIAYVRIQQISPQTYDEFIKTADGITDAPGLTTLVLDLRDNIGGVIDAIPYFMGPFIGPNQYAYDFFHQGDYVPYKTKVGFLPSLAKYKHMIVLINDKTQSSAEVMAASLKKYHAGIVVGTKSKGWGTIEQIMPLSSSLGNDKTYSVLIVQSITLREDNQPIEGRGVDPNVLITEKGWEKALLEYINDASLTQVVGQVWKSPPKY